MCIKTYCLLLLGITFTFGSNSLPNYNSSEYTLNKIIVTGSKTPQTFRNSARMVTIINRDIIETAPVQNITGLLEYACGIDVKQRGISGAQTDLSIRGSSFEQTLIMIDGQKIVNPQTGHHNLNIPVTLDNIERIEILSGHGSKLYGPNAFGGVINIITKKDKKNFVTLQNTGGEFGLLDGTASIALSSNTASQKISIKRKVSDGYIFNTDIDLLSIYSSSSIKLHNWLLKFNTGVLKKDFGANNFYAPNFPNQREYIESKSAMMICKRNTGNGNIKISANWQNNYDDFMLDKNNPDFYRNKHTTNVLSGNLEYLLQTSLGKTATGFEGVVDKIKSKSLGNHQRFHGGLYLEHQVSYANIKIIPGTSLYHYSQSGWGIWPGIDFVYLFNNAKVYTTLGRSFRLPTYTEMYYNSPSNKGNKNLKPEYASSGEIGVEYFRNYFKTSVSFYGRKGNNLIDWVKYDGRNYYQSENIHKLGIGGIEAKLTIFPYLISSKIPAKRFNVGYSYIGSNLNPVSYKSKYVLNYLSHQITSDLFTKIWGNLNQNLRIKYEKQINSSFHLIADTRLIYNPGKISGYIDINNIFDTKYIETGYIPMPGRWISAGIKLNSIL